jgi:hypothetical protein
MTDGHEAPRDAHDLADAVTELGETPEDALEAVAGRNDSLEECLPGAEPGVDNGAEAGDAETGEAETGEADGVPHGEGAPGQG